MRLMYVSRLLLVVTQLTTAKENIANADYLWGKAELQACVDSVETKIAAYELMDQDAIIATFEDDYAKSTSAETGFLVEAGCCSE